MKEDIELLDERTGSNYDYNLHMPIPTLTTFRTVTGVDLLEFSNNEFEANATLRLNTLNAKNILMGSKSRNTANDYEFLIATKYDYRNDFIVFACYVMYDTLFSGQMDKTNSLITTDDLLNNLTLMSASAYKGSVLRHNSILGVKYKYRVGY